jgi:carbon monoxide dehydrogenase subunit G
MTDAAPKDGEEAAAMSGNGSGSGGGESSSTTAMEVEKSVEAVVEETTEVRWTAAATARIRRCRGFCCRTIPPPPGGSRRR